MIKGIEIVAYQITARDDLFFDPDVFNGPGKTSGCAVTSSSARRADELADIDDKIHAGKILARD